LIIWYWLTFLGHHVSFRLGSAVQRFLT